MSQSSAPIEIAYVAAQNAIAAALVDAGFLVAPKDLHVDDPGAEGALEGDETFTQTWAAILQLATRPHRQLLGLAPTRRYIVERHFQLELASVAPDGPARKASLDAARAVIATLADADPTLQGAAERFFLGTSDNPGEEPGDLPPNGLKTIFPFTLRVRANDPLGQTQAC